MHLQFQFSEALQSVLDEKNSFEMLRGEDEDNFMFVQGCETIERDLNVITCKKLRDKNRNVIKQCYELDLVGTPLSYCIQRKLNADKVANRCVKTYLKSKVSLSNLGNSYEWFILCIQSTFLRCFLSIDIIGILIAFGHLAHQIAIGGTRQVYGHSENVSYSHILLQHMI